jgi:hypothetical protein
MSKNWVEDIAAMHNKYGVHEWTATASPYDLKKFIDFRLDFIEEEFEESQGVGDGIDFDWGALLLLRHRLHHVLLLRALPQSHDHVPHTLHP